MSTQEENKVEAKQDQLTDSQQSTINYTSDDKKLTVKIIGGHIVSCVAGFLAGFCGGVYAMSKYTIHRK